MDMVQLGISGDLSTNNIVVDNLMDDEKSIILGTSTGIYIINDGGKLDKNIQTSSSVTNVLVIDDITGDNKKDILITTSDVYFPNVKVLDSETNDKIWDFSPKMEIYDTRILWTMKQTPIFDIRLINDINDDEYNDVIISSGYNIYALDGKTGSQLWQFEDTDNTWKLLIVEDKNDDGYQDVIFGDQNGYVYLISGKTGDKIWDTYVSKSYTIVNPSTNSIVGTVTRSVWDILLIEINDNEKLIVSCEDGYIYLMDLSSGEIEWEKEVIEYVDSLLYQYYNDPIPTSMFDYNFFNLRINLIDDLTGDNNKDIIASTFPDIRFGQEYKGVKGIYLLNSDNGEIEWRNENVELRYISKPEILNLETQYIAVPVGKSGFKEKIKLLDPKDGSVYETLSINGTFYSTITNKYFLKNFEDNKFLLFSNYGDLELIEYPNKVVWNYPRINSVTIKKADLTGDSSLDLLVKSKDNTNTENPVDEGQSRILFVIDGSTKEIAWSYEMPFNSFVKTGGLYENKIVADVDGDGKSDILSYIQYPGDWNAGDMYGEKTYLIVFSGKNGQVIMNKPVTEKDYYGAYDFYLNNLVTLNQTIRQYILDEWGITQSFLEKMDSSQQDEFDKQVEQKYMEIMERKNEAKIKKRIESIDTINDQTGDGIPDFIIATWDDLFIMNSRNGKTIWNKTSRPDFYRDPISGEFSMDFFMNWSTNDRNKFITVGDSNNDGIDDLALVSWDEIVFLHSNTSAKELDYYKASEFRSQNGIHKETVKKIGDFNENGVQDLFIEKHVHDAPSIYLILDGIDGKTIMEIEKSGTNFNLEGRDLNGDGYSDYILFNMWSDTGPRLDVINGKNGEILWSYKDIEETWMVKDILGYTSVMPAEALEDLNGDGISDIAIAQSLPWQPGAEIVIYDVKNNEQIKKIIIEDIDEMRGTDRRWMPAINVKTLPDVNNDGKNELGVIISIGEFYQKQTKMFVVDVHTGNIINDLSVLGSDIITLEGTDIGMIGKSGNIYFFDVNKELKITSPKNNDITGSPIRISWEGEEAVNTILVDGKMAKITLENNVEFEIESGEHTITVYSTDKDGQGLYDNVQITVKKGTSKTIIIYLALFVLFSLLLIPKLLPLITRMKK
jgi:hypothetical protein